MRRLFVMAFGAMTLALPATAMAQSPYQGQPQGPPAQQEDDSENVAQSTYAKKEIGFHGMCGASALVPPFRAGFDCDLGVRLGSSFQVLAEGAFYGDEQLYSVLFAVGGRIHGAVFDSDTLAAHGDFKVGELSSNGIGNIVRKGLEWDSIIFKFGFGFTINLGQHTDLDISGAVLLPIVTGRGNILGLTQDQVDKSVSPVQGQFTAGIDFDWPGHPIKRRQGVALGPSSLF